MTTSSTEAPQACWWCGGPGDSQEHKYKRSDLARMLDDGGLYWGGDSGGRVVRSIRKSPEVRFRKKMCKPCNTTRSQPFDRAYETFSNYLVATMPTLWDQDSLDMRVIFGDEWRASQLALGRYYAKHFASIMADLDLLMPSGLIDFLNGAPGPTDWRMVFIKDGPLHYGYQIMTRDGFDGIGHFISPGAAYGDPTSGAVTGYVVNTRIGYVGVSFMWDQGSGTHQSFMGQERPNLYVLELTDEHRTEIDEGMLRDQADRELTDDRDVEPGLHWMK